MLEATRHHPFSSRYDLVVHGRHVGTWTFGVMRTRGDITVEGHRYRVRCGPWSADVTMAVDDDIVAVGREANRATWTAAVGGDRYQLRRTTFLGLGYRQEVSIDGSPAGWIRRDSALIGRVEAHLPTLPLRSQIFVTGALILLWDRRQTMFVSA
jgi:hypothetical protein